jgi:bifunctional DNase/RNase
MVDMVEVVLRAVRVDVGSATPLLLLEEIHGKRVLPVFIGTPEATAIAYALEHVETPRPMTHDLMDDVIEALGAKLNSVEVTGLEDHTYIAQLRLFSGSSEVSVSARPSDAIALALRSGAPILVNDELMASEGQELDLREDDELEPEFTLHDEEHEERLVEEMRLFLDSVSPRDFQG